MLCQHMFEILPVVNYQNFYEVFQLFLPYRVGDVRDIVFGVLGGLWGGVIYITLYIKIKFKNNNIKMKENKTA